MSRARKACGGFCQLALIALAYLCRILAWPLLLPGDALTAAARKLDELAEDVGR